MTINARDIKFAICVTDASKDKSAKRMMLLNTAVGKSREKNRGPVDSEHLDQLSVQQKEQSLNAAGQPRNVKHA